MRNEDRSPGFAPLSGEPMVTALAEMERELRAAQGAAARSAMLAREADHRAANMLQSAASLLRLQAAASEAARPALEAARQRLLVLAALQAHLSRHDGGERIEVGPYLREVVGLLMASSQLRSGQVELELRVEDQSWPVDPLHDLALLVSEAVINAFKHGFAEGRSGRLVITLAGAATESIRLQVEDDGVGLSSDARPGIGRQLLTGLARQLAGQVELRSRDGGGTILLAEFPRPG